MRGLFPAVVLPSIAEGFRHGDITVAVGVGTDGIAVGVVAGNGARPVLDELIVGLVTAGPRLFVVGTTGDDDTVVGLQFFDESS